MADLIDRKELRDALYEADAVTMQGVKIINQLPAVDAVPVRHGRWNDWEVFWKECSCCGYRTQKINAREYFFCPNCGCRCLSCRKENDYG